LALHSGLTVRRPKSHGVVEQKGATGQEIMGLPGPHGQYRRDATIFFSASTTPEMGRRPRSAVRGVPWPEAPGRGRAAAGGGPGRSPPVVLPGRPAWPRRAIADPPPAGAAGPDAGRDGWRAVGESRDLSDFSR